MDVETLILMMVLVFALHNLEEWVGFDRWVGLHPRLNPKLKDPFVFGAALVFLTAIALGIAVAEGANLPWARGASKVLVVALLLNVLSHCAVSIKHKRWTPGTYSGVFLVLPLTLLIAYQVLQTISEVFFCCLLSLAILPTAIFGSLWAAYAAKKILEFGPWPKD